MSFNCRVCCSKTTEFKTVGQLQAHQNGDSIHLRILAEIIGIEHDGEILASDYSADLRQQTERAGGYYNCYACKVPFHIEREEPMNHLFNENHQSKAEELFGHACKEVHCGFRFGSESELQQHRMVHECPAKEPVRRSVIKCPLCDHLSHSLADRKDHLESIHLIRTSELLNPPCSSAAAQLQEEPNNPPPENAPAFVESASASSEASIPSFLPEVADSLSSVCQIIEQVANLQQSEEVPQYADAAALIRPCRIDITRLPPNWQNELAPKACVKQTDSSGNNSLTPQNAVSLPMSAGPLLPPPPPPPYLAPVVGQQNNAALPSSPTSITAPAMPFEALPLARDISEEPRSSAQPPIRPRKVICDNVYDYSHCSDKAAFPSPHPISCSSTPHAGVAALPAAESVVSAASSSKDRSSSRRGSFGQAEKAKARRSSLESSSRRHASASFRVRLDEIDLALLEQARAAQELLGNSRGRDRMDCEVVYRCQFCGVHVAANQSELDNHLASHDDAARPQNLPQRAPRPHHAGHERVGAPVTAATKSSAPAAASGPAVVAKPDSGKGHASDHGSRHKPTTSSSKQPPPPPKQPPPPLKQPPFQPRSNGHGRPSISSSSSSSSSSTSAITDSPLFAIALNVEGRAFKRNGYTIPKVQQEPKPAVQSKNLEPSKKQEKEAAHSSSSSDRAVIVAPNDKVRVDSKHKRTAERKGPEMRSAATEIIREAPKNADVPGSSSSAVEGAKCDVVAVASKRQNRAVVNVAASDESGGMLSEEIINNALEAVQLNTSDVSIDDTINSVLENVKEPAKNDHHQNAEGSGGSIEDSDRSAASSREAHSNEQLGVLPLDDNGNNGAVAAEADNSDDGNADLIANDDVASPEGFRVIDEVNEEIDEEVSEEDAIVPQDNASQLEDGELESNFGDDAAEDLRDEPFNDARNENVINEALEASSNEEAAPVESGEAEASIVEEFPQNVAGQSKSDIHELANNAGNVAAASAQGSSNQEELFEDLRKSGKLLPRRSTQFDYETVSTTTVASTRVTKRVKLPGVDLEYEEELNYEYSEIGGNDVEDDGEENANEEVEEEDTRSVLEDGQIRDDDRPVNDNERNTTSSTDEADEVDLAAGPKADAGNDNVLEDGECCDMSLPPSPKRARYDENRPGARCSMQANPASRHDPLGLDVFSGQPGGAGGRGGARVGGDSRSRFANNAGGGHKSILRRSSANSADAGRRAAVSPSSCAASSSNGPSQPAPDDSMDIDMRIVSDHQKGRHDDAARSANGGSRDPPQDDSVFRIPDPPRRVAFQNGRQAGGSSGSRDSSRDHQIGASQPRGPILANPVRRGANNGSRSPVHRGFGNFSQQRPPMPANRNSRGFTGGQNRVAIRRNASVPTSAFFDRRAPSSNDSPRYMPHNRVQEQPQRNAESFMQPAFDRSAPSTSASGNAINASTPPQINRKINLKQPFQPILPTPQESPRPLFTPRQPPQNNFVTSPPFTPPGIAMNGQLQQRMVSPRQLGAVGPRQPGIIGPRPAGAWPGSPPLPNNPLIGMGLRLEVLLLEQPQRQQPQRQQPQRQQRFN